MAQVDLKNCIITIEEGGASVAGAVNHAADPGTVSDAAVGAISLSVASVVAYSLLAGGTFTVTGDETTYTALNDITGTSGTVNISPPLQAAITGGTGTISIAAGYPIGAQKMLIDDGGSGAVPDITEGTTFTIEGSDIIYIVDEVDATTNTSRISFHPPLDVAVANDAEILFYQFGQSLEVTIGEGNLTYEESRPVEFTLNRGVIDTVKLADEEPMAVSLEFTWEFIRHLGAPTAFSASATTTATTGATVEDALKQQGPCVGWRSVSPDPCEPYCVNIRISNDPGCGSTGLNEEILLPMFFYESLSHDLSAGTVSVSGRCKAKAASIARNVA